MRQMAVQTALYFSRNIVTTVKRTTMTWYHRSYSAMHPIKHRRGHSLAKGYKAERWRRICSEEGRRSMASDHEGRVPACILILRLLFLEGLRAEVRLVGGSLSTLGNQRRGITSKSEQE
ncbi:hypothetical protein IG631_08608 [Alternaria alternata]|nr:hypothetical protein IG631_08608 [Alternaria alternata]